jgi:hypothetical protein
MRVISMAERARCFIIPPYYPDQRCHPRCERHDNATTKALSGSLRSTGNSRDLEDDTISVDAIFRAFFPGDERRL